MNGINDNDKIRNHYDSSRPSAVLNAYSAGTDDLIFSEDGLTTFISLIKKDIKNNYHFVSTSDMAEKHLKGIEFNDDEIEINSIFTGDNAWSVYHTCQICIINKLITDKDSSDNYILNSGRYTWIRGGSLLKFEAEVLNADKNTRSVGTIYVEENSGAVKHVVQVKGFDNDGNYVNYNTELEVEELALNSPIDTSGNTRYFIEQELEDESKVFESILPTQIQGFRNNGTQVWIETQNSKEKSKSLKTNIIICDNLTADTVQFKNFNLNNNTKINVLNDDEAYRYVNNVITSTDGSSYIYTKVPVGANGDYIYNNETFATLVDVPHNSVIRIKNPIVQDWTLDKTKGNANGIYTYKNNSYYLYKQILLEQRDNEQYILLNTNDLLSKTELVLSIQTRYELRSRQNNSIIYDSSNLKDDEDLGITHADITTLSDYSSNFEYADDIQQYKFLGNPEGVIVKYNYPLITGDTQDFCEKNKLYFTDSKFYINDIEQIPTDSPDKLIYDKKIIGIKETLSPTDDLKTIQINTFTLPVRDADYSAYSAYNTYDSTKESTSITQPSINSQSGSTNWVTSSTAYKHFLKIKTINDQILELDKNDIGKIYDLNDIKSFIIEKKSYTTNSRYQQKTTTYTYKTSTNVEILKENINSDAELAKFLITDNVAIPKYQYLESWSVNEDQEYDSNKTYYKETPTEYTQYIYNENTWRDALKNNLYYKDNSNNYVLVNLDTNLNYVEPKNGQKYCRIIFANYTYTGEASWVAALTQNDGDDGINLYKFNSQSGIMDRITAAENHPTYNPNYYVFNKDQFVPYETKPNFSQEDCNNRLYYKQIDLTENSSYYSLINTESDFNSINTIYKLNATKYNGTADGFPTIQISDTPYYYLDDGGSWRKVGQATEYDNTKTYLNISFSQISTIEGLSDGWLNRVQQLINNDFNLFQLSGNNYIPVPDCATWESDVRYGRITSGPTEYSDSTDTDHKEWEASIKVGVMWLDVTDSSNTSNKRYKIIRNEYQYDPDKTYFEKAINSYITEKNIVDPKNYYIYYHYNPNTWDNEKSDLYLKNDFWFKDSLTQIYEQAKYEENTYYDIYGDFYTRAISTATNSDETIGETIEPGAGYGEFDANVEGSITTLGGIAARKSIKGYKVHGAVFNDYAEYRCTQNIEPGRCVVETGAGDLILSNQRLQLGANIVSDTYGFSIGETKQANTPIAVCGRVLAYPWEFRETFMPGQAVCSGPGGTISKMSREEIRNWPDAIVGYVSEIPQYDTWGSDKIKVDGRIWIKVK